MNKRQVIVLWIIALALAATVGVIKLSTRDTASSTTQRAPGDTLFEAFPGTDIAKIEINGADGSITVQRKDGTWVVTGRDDYPARLNMVHELLRTLADVKVTRGVEAGPSFAPRFGMDETAKAEVDRGLTLLFSDGSGKELAKISLGKNIESSQDSGMMGGAMTVGRYIRNHADESGFYAVSEMFPAVTTLASPWLDPAFINPEKITSVSMTEKGSDKVAWKVSRETEDAEFKLEDAAPGEVLDAAAGTPLKSLFSYARFEDVVPAEQIKQRADESKTCTAIIGTAEGFTYRLEIKPIKDVTDRVMLSVMEVSATIPGERKKEENESPEDAQKRDAAFASRSKELQDKLAKESKLAGRTFEVTGMTVEAILKERGQIIAKAQPAAPGEGAPANVQETPGGLIATPPVQAVTPPIEIPAGNE